jgi:DNA-binding transcriptional LysR family regulator
MFDWEDLRHFAAFARLGSLSAASRELKVDHVTVARRVSALEAALGLKLVDRRPRAYVLTGDGERIAALADRMTGEAFAVERLARAGATEPAGTVTVNAPPAAAVKLIAPRLGELAATHPRLEIELVSDLRNISLGRREADIAVRLSRPADGDLAARKVGTMGFDLYGTAAHHAQQQYPGPGRRGRRRRGACGPAEFRRPGRAEPDPGRRHAAHGPRNLAGRPSRPAQYGAGQGRHSVPGRMLRRLLTRG